MSGTDGAHTVTITDDDVPAATVSGPASVGEGGTATYEVTLDRSPSVDVDVDWAVAGTGDDAADFVGGLPSGTVRFASGTTDLTRTFTVTVADDGADEVAETFTVTVGASVNGMTLDDTATVRFLPPVSRTESTVALLGTAGSTTDPVPPDGTSDHRRRPGRSPAPSRTTDNP